MGSPPKSRQVWLCKCREQKKRRGVENNKTSNFVCIKDQLNIHRDIGKTKSR